MVVSEWAKVAALNAGIGAFRHGFIEHVQEGTGVVVFAAPGRTYDSACELAHELDGYGVNVLLVENGVKYIGDWVWDDEPSMINTARGPLVTLPYTVELNDIENDFQNVLSALVQAECNIHFVYAFLVRPHGKSAIALHVEDNDLATSVLSQAGFKLIGQRDISR